MSRHSVRPSLLQDNREYHDVHWRLVWEDTCYGGGILPDESVHVLRGTSD
ncbi:Imm72 family immunity protein [Enterobacteriaceae bacterium LUAb1]